jgi:thiol-disulfide isomerase/thioredoxin
MKKILLLFVCTATIAAARAENYDAYFKRISRGDKTLMDSLKKVNYAHLGALKANLELTKLYAEAPASADIRAQIVDFVESNPVAAYSVGWGVMRYIGKNREFDRYVDTLAAKIAGTDPMGAAKIARYIANNYLATQSDPVLANPWVDRYLEWSGDPNYDPKITRITKQMIGEWQPDDYGKQMPDARFRDLDGNVVTMENLHEGFVLIDFWASWCGPCRGEIPHVKKAWEKVKHYPVKFASVSIDDSEAAWRKAAVEIDVPWTNVLGDRKEIRAKYGVSAIPRIIVLDPEGRLVADGLNGKTIETQILRLAEKYGW